MFLPFPVVQEKNHELVALAQLSGETAGVALLDGDTVHYVDQVETPNPVRVRDWTGTRAPLWAVPSGLVLMAGMAAPALERILALPLERLTERTVVEPVAIRARLKTIARDGHAWGREEYVEGITSVAAAVADGRGELVGALHIHGPSYRFPPPGAEDEIAAALTAAAARVSGRLRTGARKGGSGSTGPGSRARAVAGPASRGPVSRQA